MHQSWEQTLPYKALAGHAVHCPLCGHRPRHLHSNAQMEIRTRIST